jgi:hypothetical protein
VSKRYEFELGWIDSAAPYPLKWSYKTASGALVSGNLIPSTTIDEWHHVALVRDAGTGEIRGYRDGTLVSTSTYATSPGSSSYNLNIGRNPGGSQRFRGMIDEVRLYGRALSTADVAALAGTG